MSVLQRLGRDQIRRHKLLNVQKLQTSTWHRVVVPKTMQQKILKEVHDNPLGGHKGRERTL